MKNAHLKSFLLAILLMIGEIPLICSGQLKISGKEKPVPNYSEYKARQYIDNASELDDIEGIWFNGDLKYSIEKDPVYPRRFRAILLETGRGNMVWKPGDIHFYLEKTATEGAFQMTFFGAEGDFYTMRVNIVPQKTTCIQTAFGIAEYRLYDNGRDSGRHGWINNSLTKLYPYQPKKKKEETPETKRPTEWSGSGFALNKGYIATNYHVVENASSITIRGVNGNLSSSYNATVVASGKHNDLALLKITNSDFTGFGTIPYKMKTTTSEAGEDVFVLGYPLTSTMGDEIKLTTGIISSKTGFQGDVSQYQISAPVQPGNSGGPLFDGSGNLIGIVSAKHGGAENVGYAIKASYLKNLLESTVSSSIIPANNTIAGQSLTGKVKAVKNYVFMIECSSICLDKEVDDKGRLSITIKNTTIESDNFTFELKGIDLNDKNTILVKRAIPMDDDPTNYINSDQSEFIEDAETFEKYYILESSISFYPEKTIIGLSERTFTETYPKLPQNVKRINIWSGDAYYIKNFKIRE